MAQELALGRKMGRDLVLLARRQHARASSPSASGGAACCSVDVLNGGVARDHRHGGRAADRAGLVARTAARSPSPATSGGRFDIFAARPRERRRSRNLTNDDVFDGAPVYSPDGTSIVVSLGGRRATPSSSASTSPTRPSATSSPAASATRTTRSSRRDGKRIYFTSDRNGTDNIYSLDLATGEVAQFTNVVTGAFMPTVLASSEGDRLVYTGYWKGRFDLHIMDEIVPIPGVLVAAEAAAAAVVEKAMDAGLQIGQPAPPGYDPTVSPQTTVPSPPPPAGEPVPEDQAVQDTAAPRSPDELPVFEPDITATIDDANKEPYGGFKLFIEDAGAAVGVNTDQTFYSDVFISLTDYLGNHRMMLVFSSIESFANYDLAYYSLKRRWNWGARVFDHRTYYIGFNEFEDTIERGRAAYSETGGQASLTYPMDFYHRFEVAGGYMLRDVQYQGFEGNINGEVVPVIVPREDNFPYVNMSLVGDTTVNAGWGPVSGRRWRLNGSYAPDIEKDQLAIDGSAPGSVLSATVDLDGRQYFQVSQRSSLAMRLFVGASFGNAPQPYYFGGLDTLRGFDFRDFSATGRSSPTSSTVSRCSTSWAGRSCRSAASAAASSSTSAPRTSATRAAISTSTTKTPTSYRTAVPPTAGASPSISSAWK